jgi:hypothetical protein
MGETCFGRFQTNGVGGTCLVRQKALGNWRWSLILAVCIDEGQLTSRTSGR